MEETIASGRIEVNLDDRSALNALDRIEAEYSRTMKKIDSMEAEATIGADLDKLDDAVRNAKRKVKEIDGLRGEVELGIRKGDEEELAAALKSAQAEVKRLNGKKATVELKYKSDQTQLATARKQLAALDKERKDAVAALEKIRKAAAKAEADRQKAELDLAKRVAKTRKALHEQRNREEIAAEREAHSIHNRILADERRDYLAWEKRKAQVNKSLEAQRAREMTNAERDAWQMERSRQRELDAIPKLQRQYAELARTIGKLNETRRKSHNIADRSVLSLKINEVTADRAAIKARLKALGIDPIEIGAEVEPGSRFGDSMRQAVTDGYRQGGVGRASINAGLLAGMAFSAGVSDGIRRNLSPRNILKAAGGGLATVGGKIAKGLQGLSEATVRIGPFTTSIRGAISGLALLSPIVVDIVGALGSLVGVVGSATLGLTALTAGFLGGAIPAALGFGFVIKDVVQEFKAAKKATKAYNDAVMKYGKSSDQAAKKMKELKTIMGNVSDETVKQFANAQKLGAAWDKATKPGRASVWKGIGEALQTASAIMPQFAKRTNEGLGVAEKGISRMMKAVRSKEGKGILDNLMGNFNAALGPLLNGLGNLAGYLGRVASIASDAIPGIAKTFERWSESVLSTSENTASLRERVDKVIQSAKDVGNFFLAAGRLVKAFFGGGVDAGQSFTRTMTDAMNRWTAFLNTTKGQNSLAKFFREAVAGTQALWGFLQPIVSSFVRWATLIAPVARGFFAVGGAIADLVAALLRLTGLAGPVTALLTTLGVLWGIGKVSAATRAVIGFTRALFGMAGAQKAVAAASATGAMAGGAGMVGAGVLGAAGRLPTKDLRAVDSMGRLAKAGSAATKVMSGLGAATLGLANPLAGLAIVAGAAGFGLYKYITRTRDFEKSQKTAQEATQRFTTAVQAMGPAQNQLAQEYLNSRSAALQVRSAEKEVADLRKRGMTNTDQYTQAVLNLRQAELTLASGKAQLQAASRNETSAYREMNKEARQALGKRNDQVEQLHKQLKTFGLDETFNKIKEGAKKAGMSVADFAKKIGAGEVIQRYADALTAQERAQYRVRRASELSVLATLNHQRAMKGLAAITASAAGKFAQLQKLGGKNLAKSIAVKFTDSGDAARVARSASATLKSGVPTKLVTKIVADSKNAEDAIRRLQRARIDTKKLRVVESGGREAVAMIQRLTGIKLSPKQQRIAQRGGEEAMAMLRRLLGVKLSKKDQRIAEQGGGSVLATLRAIAATNLPNKRQVITIETHKILRNSVVGGATGGITKKAGPGAASGKRAGAKGASDYLIGEGRDDEWGVNRRTGEVYKTNGPQFVRLDRDDAIIPTEPRYRSRGKEIFKAIAKDLGLNLAASGREPARKKTKRDPVFGGSFGAEGFSPKATISRGKVFKPSKRNKKPFTARRGWADYIEGLQTQQGYWEREVSIRESQVQEPADMVIETGSRDVTDPATGEVTKVPIYGPNPEIENSYKPAIAKVLDAMKTLMSIIVELVRAIPQAVKANRAERTYHTSSISELNSEIKKENNRKVSNKGDAKEKHEKRLDALRERRDKHIEARKELQESEVTLNEDRVDSGFDQREAQIAQSKLQAEYDSASGNATAEAAKQNADAQPTSSGSGSGGSSSDSTTSGAASDQLSYGQQASLADTERANVLREFGSNMMAAMGAGVPSSAGMAGSGPGAVNPAARSLTGSSAATAGVTPSAASASFAGAGAASRAAQSPSAGYAGQSPVAPAANKTVNITNNFSQPPPDTHTFVKGMEFESAGAF